MKNRYGLDVSYFSDKLELILRDIDNYTEHELCRELARLAESANKDEFNKESGLLIKGDLK